MNRLSRWILGLGSAPLAALVFPPFGFDGFGIPFLAVFAWLPLLLSLHGSTAKENVYRGFIHGFIFYAITFSWFTALFANLAVILWLILATFSALTCWGLHFLISKKDKLGTMGVACLGASLWVGFEFLRGEVYFLKFPWMTPGMGMGPTWWHPLLGVYASTFLIVFSGITLSFWRKKPTMAQWTGLLLAVTCLLSIRSPLVGAGQRDDSSGIPVLAVQALHPEADESQVAAIEFGAKFIVWPEYSRPGDARRIPFVRRSLEALATNAQATLILGTTTDLPGGENYNTALSIGESGILGEHHKNHPVHFFDDGKIGPNALPISTPLGKVGTSICFDNDYQDTALSMTQNGAEFFLVPSLDAVSWTLREHLQHSDLARHRAAENHREFVVASGQGITQHIDAQGRRVAALPQPDPGMLTTKVIPHRDLTFFTQYGWLFGWVNLGVTGIIVLWLLVEKFKKRRVAKSA